MVSYKALPSYPVACPTLFMVQAQWGCNPHLQCPFFLHLLASLGAPIEAMVFALAAVAWPRWDWALPDLVGDGPAPIAVLPSRFFFPSLFDPGKGHCVGGMYFCPPEVLLQFLAEILVLDFDDFFFNCHPYFNGRHPGGQRCGVQQTPFWRRRGCCEELGGW